jgi:hypothetical protein
MARPAEDVVDGGQRLSLDAVCAAFSLSLSSRSRYLEKLRPGHRQTGEDDSKLAWMYLPVCPLVDRAG